MTDRIPLQQMIKVVEREIVTLKRLAGARAETSETATGETLVGLKAIAALLNEMLERERTGTHLVTIGWQQIDPGRAMPDSIMAPALLSVLTKIPGPDSYRPEVFYLGQDSDRHKAWNVYAHAPMPAPAPIGTPAGLLVPTEPANALS